MARKKFRLTPNLNSYLSYSNILWIPKSTIKNKSIAKIKSVLDNNTHIYNKSYYSLRFNNPTIIINSLWSKTNNLNLNKLSLNLKPLELYSKDYKKFPWQLKKNYKYSKILYYNKVYKIFIAMPKTYKIFNKRMFKRLNKFLHKRWYGNILKFNDRDKMARLVINKSFFFNLQNNWFSDMKYKMWY